MNALIAYSTNICMQAGLENPVIGNLSLMATMLGFSIISSLLMERAGRRALMLSSSSLMALGHAFIAYQFLATRENFWGPPMLALVGLWAYIIGFSTGAGSIPWLILGEIFPMESRGIGSAIGAAANWTTSFLVTLAFPTLEGALSKEGAFALFGCLCIGYLAFVWVWLPETKGKSIEEVLELLRNGRRVSSSS
eukprot:NODE_10577_length_1342_cov_3.439506.p2 GENE.NODE_10577_length_1342_cov_3.439506~~NODE_10577_length_1342_cov_3.439506.p2  ORF type:complete len:194 (+),score=54.02 NODE_10577_length_1342_cov_3.439506:738-1319(+)